MVKCPNKNHPEWKELERLLPNQAYVVWDAFPHGIDKAPNGADSKLFKDLLEHYGGDRDSAIKAKAKTVTNAFKTWFGDWTKVSKVKAVEKAKDEYTQEMKDILAKAPRDSQGRLLAPNGKLSNLTERQYAQVRTKAFKDWFGDWERVARSSKFRESHDIPNSITSATYQGVSVSEVTFDPDMAPDGGTRIIFLGDEYIGEMPVIESKDKIKMSGAIGAATEIEEEYRGKGYGKKAHLALANIAKSEGKTLYSDRSNSDAEDALWKSLVKEGIAEVISESPKVGHWNHTTYRIINDKLPQADDINPGDRGVSKVVDKNGEPLVVYRGINDNNYSKPYAYFTNRKNEANIYSKGLLTKGGQFFTNHKDTIFAIENYIINKYNINELDIDSLISIIEDYENNGKEFDIPIYEDVEIDTPFGIPDIQSKQVGSKKEKYISNYTENEYNKAWEDYDKLRNANGELKELLDTIHLIKNTTITDEGQLTRQYDDVSYIEDKDKLNKLLNKYSNIISNNKSNFKPDVQQVFLNIKNPYIDEINSEDLLSNNKAYSNKHDGAFLMSGDHYLVKNNSNQIKSATDNIGTFSRDNNDIRDREVPNSSFESLDTEEERTILSKAKRDDSGKLLAPNGKPTNLTEAQYVQVRTKAFKEWFGDWENPRQIEKKVTTVLEVSSNQNWVDGSTVVKRGNSYFYTNDDGMNVEITKNEFDDFNEGKTIILNKKTKVIKELDTNFSKILDENGEPLVMYHRSATDIKVFDISKSRHGGFWFSRNPDYYENTKAKLPYAIPVFINIRTPNIVNHETFLAAIDGDVTIEGGLRTNRYDGWITLDEHIPEFHGDEYSSSTVFAMATNSDQIKSATDKEWFGDRTVAATGANESVENSSSEKVSKVVDENGEPLVVYHHSARGEFDAFNIPDYNESLNADMADLSLKMSEDERMFFDYVPEPEMKTGVFFSTDIEYSKVFGSTKYAAFLNLRNPSKLDRISSKDVADFRETDAYAAPDAGMQPADGVYGNDAKTLSVESKGTEYVAFYPNQIKSIDNTGEFGETGNIFYKIMESVNKAEKELFNDRSIYNKRFYEKLKTFTDSSSAIKFLLDNGYIQEEYVKLAELLMAHSVKLSISKDFVNNGKLGSYTPGMKIGESSIELTKDTFTKRPDIVAEVLLHEVMHHYLGYRYDMDAEFRKRVDMLHKKYASLATENEKKSFYGLREGREEFLIEAVTNSELRNWMQSKDKELESSLYNRLKRLIAKALLLLGVHNANAYNLNDITGAITYMVENISKREAPLSERKYSKSEAVRRFGGLDINHVQNKKDSDYIRTMEQEAGVTRVRIEQGIKSRIKAFEQYGKATYNQVRVMEQELANLQELWQKNEDKEAMIRFINHAAREADKPIRAIDAAFEEYKATGKFSLRNNQLIQIYRDFIGFYEPVIENINEKLFTIGYFDDLSDTEYEFLGNSIGAVTEDFSRIKSKYSALLANRFGDIIIEAAKEYKMDEAVIRAYVQDHKNYTSEDISWFHTYVGDMKVTKDKTLNLIARKIADLKNEIDRQTVSKASEVLPVFQAVSGSKWQLLYEKDDKGKKTGYLVRDRKYGKFYAERDAYFDSLGEAPIGDKEALREWYAKRNEWLKEHAERRYKPEYYDLFNNMSFAAREARDKIQFEISSTLSKYMDVKGNVHVERISEDDWNKLQVMYQEKRRLSNTYNNDGSKKTGIDLDIAEELQIINEELNKNLSYKSNKERFEKVRAEKEASLSKEDYDRWYKRSTRWAYTEEFQKLLDSIDKRDYGLENPLYAELNEEKKELTKMYRNTHDFMINTKLMPDSVKKRIVEIDNILEEIRSKAERRKKEGLTFDKIAKIVYSNYYYAEKQHAIDMDEKNPGYYEKWRKESHTINKKGKLIPHSYYNLMIPNDSKHMEFVPSREFTEIDPESPYWNDQYDINNPEPYQPKKSLYDNSEAYNKVMNDPKLKAIHEVVVNTMAEANEKISFLKRGNNYKLPQITGGAWAFIKANRGVVKGMSRFVRDKYFEDRDDDVDFNYQSYAPDGQPLDTIPTHYMRMLDDPSTITSNLAGALMEYYNMAVNFEKKQQVLPEIKIVQNQVRTRQVQPNWLESKLDRYTTYTPNTQSRASKRLDRFLETNIFGNKYNSIRVGKFNIVKALVGLKNYATLVNLGANIFVAAANVMGSAHQHFTEALTGVYYTPRTALIALRNSLYHMSSMLLHMGKTTHSDKLLSLMNMNQIARENSNMYKRLNYNRFARFLMNHLWYGMMTAGDVFTKGQILTSVYLNTKYVPEHDRFMMRDEYLMLHRDDKKAGKKFSKLNTMNLYDMYEASGINAVLKTGKKYERYHKYITPDLTNRVTNVTRYLAQRADGMMDDSSRNFAQANAVTGFVFMHKNFILSAAEDRVLKATEYNFMLERVDEAQYRTVARRIKETVKYLWQAIKYYVFRKQAGVEKPTLRKTEFYENYNMKRVKIESSLVIAYMFISMLLNSYRGDDDKWWMQAIKYAHDRATYEAGNLYNPMDLFNTFKALSPAASSLENAKTVALAITALLDSDSNIFKETKYGPYSGFRRVTKAAFKTTPLKNVIEATDPKSKHKYLKGQLQ